MKHTSNYFIKEVYFKSILFGQKKYIWSTFEKKRMEILSVYTSVPKIMIICYTVPEIWHMMNIISIFHFELFFCPFTPMTARKTNFFQKMQKSLEISLFCTCVPKIMIKWCTVPEIWFVTDGRKERWTDGQMDVKSDI